MKALCYLALVALLTGCVATPSRVDAPDSQAGLDHWVDAELIPYLERSLTEHPRLRHEPVVLVRLHEGVIQPRIDGLTRDLRERVGDALAVNPAVRLARRDAAERHHRRLSGARCSDPLDQGYFIGIETSERPGGQWRVAVRVLDAREDAWVSGVGLSWHGRLTPAQRAARERGSEDEWLRGLRVLPFEAGQPDLAAAYFANNLSCLLRQRGLSESRLYLVPPTAAPHRLATLLALLDNYLSRLHQVQVVDRAEAADYLLESEFHPIDRGIYQLWLRLRPRGEAAQVSGVDTAAYLRLEPVPTRPSAMVQATAVPPRPVVRELTLLQARHPSRCGVYADPGAFVAVDGREPLPADACYRVRAAADGRLFLAFLGPDGLYRIAARGCDARLSRQDGIGTLYALSVSDAALADRVGRLWRQLPDACRSDWGDVDPGGWSRQLDRLVARAPDAVAWSARRYRFFSQEAASR